MPVRSAVLRSAALSPLLLYASIFLLALLFPPGQAAAQETALSIVEKSDQIMRGETQAGTYRMVITRPEWERELEFDFWSEGTKRSFIRIQKPQREKGVSFLRLEREMWQYVPKINRTIKIPPSMRLQSWMGSNFTNDDLVRESSIVHDYEHALLGTDTLDTGTAYMIELIPKPEAPVTWDRIVQWIRTDDYLPLRGEYFNERGERVRTIEFSGFKTMHGRTLPAIMTLFEDKSPGHSTMLELVDVEFNAKIKPSVFTQQNLKRSTL